eukprot:TRINITY_DN473_c0_g1_i1.p3 TRINITY_DN473_c0_g1~~TRINITY_DN473_c0_g1_i1.p3  ORF type:complete len:104 (+),score=4.93 TRINITY_DN473_c0_g1_i1:777-1088(+)
MEVWRQSTTLLFFFSHFSLPLTSYPPSASILSHPSLKYCTTVSPTACSVEAIRRPPYLLPLFFLPSIYRSAPSLSFALTSTSIFLFTALSEATLQCLPVHVPQ